MTTLSPTNRSPRRLVPLALVTMAILSTTSRAAAPLDDGVLTVKEAYTHALEHNPEYRNTLLARDRLLARRTSELGWEAPEVSYLREGINSARSAPGEERWTLTQEVPSLGAVSQRRGSLSSRLDAADRTAVAARRHLRARVKNAYASVVHQETLVRLRRDQLRLVQRAEAAVTLRLELGEASRRESLQSRLTVVAARNDLQSAESAFDQARYALFALVGLAPDDQEYGVVFPDTLRFQPVDFAQDESLEQLDTQPRYLAAQAELKAAESALSAERWKLLPALTVSVYLQNYDGDGYDNRGFEVGARLPLWFMPGHQGRIGEARAEVARRRWRQAAELLDMKREIEQAWHGYDTSLGVIESLAGETLAQSDELLELTLEGYNAGEVGLLELIAAQQTNIESRLRYQNALYDFHTRLVTLENYLPDELVTPVDQDVASKGAN